MSASRFVRVDIFNKSEQNLNASVNELILKKIRHCALDGYQNPVVRIAPNTYVNVKPSINTHNMIGWSLGNQQLGELPVFFEVKKVLNHNRPSIMSVLAGKNPVWNVTCVGKDTKMTTSKIQKVLVVKYINDLPIERVMQYWAPIVQKLGNATRGGEWRIPLMYMTRPGSKYEEGPLGLHIPLPEDSLRNKNVKDLFSQKGNNIECVFDMENLKVVTIDDCEYLVAMGGIANNQSSLFSISMVIGVYNQVADEREEDLSAFI